MAVLIEAICLVVPRQVLDVSFPGGTDGFLVDCTANDSVRYAIADAHVAAVSTFDPQALEPLIERLADLGIVGADDSDRAFEFVFVDMQTGPVIRCDWLSITHHRHGFTFVERVSQPTCAFETPQGWLLDQSWRLTRTDIREEGPDSVMTLGINDGIETVLDLRSGQLVSALPNRSTVEYVEAEGDFHGAPARDERWMAAHRVFVALGVPHQILTSERVIAAPFALDELKAPYDQYVDDDARLRILVGPAADANAVQCEVILPKRFSMEDVVFGQSFVEWEAKDRYGWSDFSDELQHDSSTGTLSVRHRCMRNGDESWDDVVERACTESSARGTVTLLGFEKFSRADLEQVMKSLTLAVRQNEPTGTVWDAAEAALSRRVAEASERAGTNTDNVRWLRSAKLACGRVVKERKASGIDGIDLDAIIRELEA